MSTSAWAFAIALSGSAVICGCSDLVVGKGQPPPKMQGSAGAPAAGGTAGAVEVDSQVPLSTACDFDAPIARAEAHGECDDDGWCWEDPLPIGTKVQLASLPGAKELWLWSARGLHRLVDGKWTMQVAPTTLDVTGAVVLAPDDIWLTIETLSDSSSATYLYHFDGSAWTRVQNVVEALSELRAGPEGTLWAIAHGANYDRIERYDGKQWQIMDERSSPAGDYGVVDFRPVSDDEAWVLRNTGVEHVAAGGWLRIDAPEGITLTAFDRLPDGSVWVAGYGAAGRALLFQIVDDGFSPRALPDFDPIRALGGTSVTDMWLGTGGRVDHFDGEQLTLTHQWFGPFVHGLIATDASNLFVLTTNADAGSTGTIIHWDGRHWDDEDQLMPDISSVWGAKNDDIWASGSSGRFHFDGKAWQKTSDVGDYALWGTASDNVYALGGLGVIERFDGQSWTLVVDGNAYGKRERFTDHDCLSGDAPNSLWIAAGGVWHYDGAQLSRVSEDVGATSIKAFTAKDVWVATGIDQSRADLLHYDGVKWKSMGVPALHVWGTSSQNLWVVEDPGDNTVGYFMSHFDGTTWTKYRPRENTFSSQYPSQYGQNMSQMGGCDDYLWVSEGNRINLFDGKKWSTIMRDGPFNGAIWGRSPDALVVAGHRGGLIRRAR